jgi:hypothetical protein
MGVPDDRVPIAGIAGVSTAQEHNAFLFDAVALEVSVGAHPRCALCGGAHRRLAALDDMLARARNVPDWS